MHTPMLQQFLRIKRSYPDAILFFRMGDFYEMFFEDAKIASKILEIALTSRSKDENIPMCGVPWHSAENYIAKLIKRGFKVAICEQMENPAIAKGIVKREIVRVFTPSTFDGDDLTLSVENYLISIVSAKNKLGICLVEPTTGDMKTAEINTEEAEIKIQDLLAMFSIKEIIYPLSHSINKLIPQAKEFSSTALPDWVFNYEYSFNTLIQHFKTTSISQFGIEKSYASIAACGAAIHYLKEILKSDLPHINSLRIINFKEILMLDSVTIRNLELIKNIATGSKEASLYGILDLTNTPGGSRMLKQWIIHPLLDIKEINKRLDAIEELNKQTIIRGNIRNSLKNIADMDRICSKISNSSINPRELLLLLNILKVIPDIKNYLQTLSSELISQLQNDIYSLEDVKTLIQNSINEQPPFSIKEGGLIKQGYDKSLDELRLMIKNNKSFIAQIEEKEKKRTSISNLRIAYNKIFGYYIEITKSNLHLVPSDYERKQTLVNTERFTTPILKEYETKILGAEEKINEMEYELFCNIREKIKLSLPQLQQTSRAISTLDVLASLSEAACKYKYCKPKLHTDTHISIKSGRHPVIERLQFEQFIPNDAYLNNEDSQILIITGPNMGGKSTYLRQIALICLMAHIGSFVPADSAEIPIIDKIFTRVGASDNLVQGQSTFMVEMLETANILNNATQRSLIILDEIGRGTSTFDGMAIAWAIIEYLHNNHKIAAKTLFATHFHELTTLASYMPKIKNYSIAVKEYNEQILFLRKIIEGASDKSYGIQVARLAGLPKKLIDRSKNILSHLEQSKSKNQILNPYKIQTTQLKTPITHNQNNIEKTIINKLKQIDINTLTPLEAFNLLTQFIKTISEHNK